MTPILHARARLVPICLSALAAAWLVLVTAPPVLRAGGHPALAFLVMESFSSLCHQIPERSFTIAGVPLAVCARCTGIGVGFLAGSLGWALAAPERRGPGAPSRWLLLSAAIPSLVESLAERAGGHGSVAGRAMLGGAFGFVLVFYVVPAIEELPRELRGELLRLSSAWRRAHAASR